MLLLADGPNATLQTERLDQCRSLIKSRKNKSSRDMFFVHSLIVSLEILLLFRPIVDGVFFFVRRTLVFLRFACFIASVVFCRYLRGLEMNQFIRVATGINNFRLFYSFVLSCILISRCIRLLSGVLMTFLSLGFRVVSPVAAQLQLLQPVATARSLC